MATYSVNGGQFEVPLYGLRIEADTNEKSVLFLEPIDNNWDKYFSADSAWIASGDNRAIIVYADENNLRNVDRLGIYLLGAGSRSE